MQPPNYVVPRGFSHDIHDDLAVDLHIYQRLGCAVWMKMETQQISGSFKYRGISLLCKKTVEKGCREFVCSSAGNAGLAATCAAMKLNRPITVYVPETTSEVVRDKLQSEGAFVQVYGKVWDTTNQKGLEAASKEGVEFIHPFDNPTIWEGHATMISEIKDQLGADILPDVIIASVGGGGLMNGLLHGMHQCGWSQVPFVAMETVGTDSLNACAKAGEWVELDDITSIAKCLGVRRVCKKTYDWLSEHNVLSCVVPDEEALKACIFMADEYSVYIPPSCGAAVAAVTSNNVLSQLQSEGKLPLKLHHIVVIVCGGSGVDSDKIEEWRKMTEKQ